MFVSANQPFAAFIKFQCKTYSVKVDDPAFHKTLIHPPTLKVSFGSTIFQLADSVDHETDIHEFLVLDHVSRLNSDFHTAPLLSRGVGSEVIPYSFIILTLNSASNRFTSIPLT